MANIIGGNLQSIQASADRMTKSAQAALDTHKDTATAADQLTVAIEEAMTTLTKRFETIAGVLQTDITASHTELKNADWKGKSYDNAVILKGQLQGEVDRVLREATKSLDHEKSNFNQRAQDLLSQVNDQFKKVMEKIDFEYNNLADASIKTMQNLEAADGTITMGS